MTDTSQLEPPLFAYADLSTAHLPRGEFEDLGHGAPAVVIQHLHGAWVNVPTDALVDDEWQEFPHLRHLVEWARGKGARWINLDQDGDTVADLPTWEW